MRTMRQAIKNCMTEWSFTTGANYANPFQDIALDVVITDPHGQEQVIPTFWAGDGVWRVRYAPRVAGTHHYHTICSDADNAELHDRQGTLLASPYQGDNLLLRHGSLQVSSDNRYLQHRDGTPFFWLADTWWMSLCKRLEWPGEYKTLAADRVAKGFSVIQIIAGLYPDMPAFDPRGANEAGYPWDEEYSTINPAYFDMADLRIDWLVRSGLAPCLVGCWGYFLPWMGVEKMKQHWRHLIARYGAYPVVWCLAGEGTMPYYLSEDKEGAARAQKQGWTELAAYVRAIDPYHHPLTIHPTDSARRQVEDESLLDLDLLQTGHGDRASIPNTIKLVTESYASTPRLPVINSEVCYEGIAETCRQELQRFMFWSCLLSGACGHTYGANGIWQLNRREQSYGPSPHGSSWGETPWEEAYLLPGSTHVGVGKRLLERYEWWRFEPHPEWVENHATADSPTQPFAAGIAGEVRIFFLPNGWTQITVQNLEADISYRAFLFDPKNGQERDLGRIEPDASGNWKPPFVHPPILQDWVLVLERV
ncbi:MAG TPA: DUF4038 domain-containing protein [Abditibacteriaceae bacterium]|nr:DUF4038 domain-containing protein [Abditibacteriaceae bacterium]